MREEAKSDGNANSGSAAIVIASGQYEKFLEATGLSQKSILTPTRMFSNHRLVFICYFSFCFLLNLQTERLELINI